MITTKRIYDKPRKDDGFRILVDRLWPRGLSKDEVKVDAWLKDIAPSNELRKWFTHQPEKWDEFRKRYFEELQEKKELVDFIIQKAKKEKVTLLYAAKDEKFNNAVSLKEHIKAKNKRLQKRGRIPANRIGASNRLTDLYREFHIVQE